MVAHPWEYPWSSYRHTARGEPDGLLTAQRGYRRPGKSPAERQVGYRQLFRARIAERSLVEVREASNKAWVLGDECFKRRVERQLKRRVAPRARGGDRKSKAYRKQASINRVRPY